MYNWPSYYKRYREVELSFESGEVRFVLNLRVLSVAIRRTRSRCGPVSKVSCQIEMSCLPAQDFIARLSTESAEVAFEELLVEPDECCRPRSAVFLS